MTKIYVFHDKGANPGSNWYQEFAKSMGNKGYPFQIQGLPNPNFPVIKKWTKTINDTLRFPDPDKYVVAHGLACKALLKVLEETTYRRQYGGVFLVAPTLEEVAKVNASKKEGRNIRDWNELLIDYEKVRGKSRLFYSLLSDDPPAEDALKDIEELRSIGSEIVLIPGKGKYNTKKLELLEDRVKEEIEKH